MWLVEGRWQGGLPPHPRPLSPVGGEGASAGGTEHGDENERGGYECEHEHEHEHEGRDCWGGWLGVLIRRVRGLRVSSVAGFGQPWQDKQSQHE